MNITVVAVASGYPKHDYLVRGYEAFLKSSRRYGYDPLILGWEQPWRGLGSKPKLLKQAIEKGRISTDFMIFADAYDVWFAKSPRHIVDTFAQFTPAKIVWNGEKNCFPRADWAHHHPHSTTSFRFFNSGLSVGRTADYLTVLTQMEVDKWPDDHQNPDGSWHHVNDQHHFMEKFLFGQCNPGEPKMAIDSTCLMFQTLVATTPDEFIIEPGKVVNKDTGTEPMAFHANGNAKDSGVMEPILQSLGL